MCNFSTSFEKPQMLSLENDYFELWFTIIFAFSHLSILHYALTSKTIHYNDNLGTRYRQQM